MLFLALEDVHEQVAGDEVAHRLAMRDRFLEHGDRLDFHRQVGAQDLLDSLADAQAAEQLEIGKSFEE